MEFQQSRTFTNLQNAYNMELMQSTLYSIYGDIVRQEGFRQIGNVYDIFQRNNKEHARIWLRQLNEGVLPDSREALQASVQQEYFNGNQLYREYALIANEEGYNDIEALFNGVANIDLNHALQLEMYYDDVIRNQVFCKEQPTLWICMQCGNIMGGDCAPEICPVCGFPQSVYRQYGVEPV
ncbi:MAG: rubrerythrin family protein [Clostridiales bacterium]|jgi:rubrerythrin|nr:rubrerythrin family protein [Clostridiales bacterium]